MKVHFDNVNLSARTGPNTFAQRLAPALIERGHDLVTSGSDADVSLVFIEPSGRPLAKRVVQRLDGIWFKPGEFATKNVNIRALYERADSVVWQSVFDMGMTSKWFGMPKKGIVIRNGIDTTPVKELTIPELLRIRKQHEMVFVCSSNWHAQKRLRANIELFDHLRQNFYPTACFIVMGANPDVYVPHPSIYYTGSQPPEVYLQVFAMANWMIHLAWTDHCPNVVIEALAQGTPVICSEAGGTRELVGDFGIVVKEQQAYNFELADYDNPPQINVTQIGKLPHKSTLGSHANIDIKHVVEQYETLLREVLQ